MDTKTIRCQINPREIGFINHVFEAYPGFAVIRTDDAKLGLIQLWVSPDFYDEVKDILADLANSIYLKIQAPLS
ncbi:MAG: DUF4911 domain-containing protein [bacterium]|nr:DUF4911 domain-containing protein [bacterium]